MFRAAKILAVSLGATLVAGERVTAAAPTVESVLPGVGPRGGEFTVLLTGGRLKDACEIIVYDKGLAFKRLDVVSDNEVKATLAASADCSVGAHPFRLRTPGGLSELRVVHVSRFPVIAEVEPNETAKEAMPIALNSTVAGVIDSGDVDSFVVTLQKGQRISAEVEAIRLGGEMTDMLLTVVGPDGRTITEVDDTLMARQDPFVSLIAPNEGRYLLKVRDAAFGGGPSSTYALHIGDFPRPHGVYPPGGQSGKDVRLKLLGPDGDAAFVDVKLPEDVGPWWNFYPSLSGSIAPTASPLRVRPYSCVDETDAAATALLRAHRGPSHDWPVAFHGVLGQRGGVDTFAVNARAGDVIQVEVFAERIGSRLDSIVEILNPEGELTGRSDDDSCHDSRIVWKAETDGAYRIEISDKRHEGGSAYFYRIEVDQPRPALEVFLPGMVRKSQAKQVIAVPRGNRVLAHLGVRREGFDAPVRLAVSGLPKGVSLDVNELPAGVYLTPIVIEAAADAPLGASLVSVNGVATTPGGSIQGGFQQTVDLIPATGDSSYQSVTVDRLAVVVTAEAPYRVSLSAPKTSLARDGAIEVVATVERSKGYDEAVEVTLPYLPPGVEMEGAIVLPPTESKAVFRLFARPDADPVSWRLAAEVKTAPPRMDRRAMTIALQTTLDPAAAGTGGRRRRAPIEAAPEVASKFVALELSAANISGRLEPATVEQGKTVVIVCQLATSLPFNVSMEASLEGLPARVTATPVSLTPGQLRVEFPVAVSQTAPIGEHNSLLCQLTGKVDGQVTVYRVGRGGLLTVVAPGALTRDANGKPMSPLEALRRREHGLAGPNKP
jgi:hypothetical protein